MPSQSDPLPLDHQLCFSIYSAEIAINRAYRPVLEGLGVTYPQYLVLSTLWEHDGLAVGAIAERLALESSTITPLVKRLEAAGFVSRARNPADERQVIVNLTPQGRDLHSRTKLLGETLFKKSGLTLDQIIRLNRDVQVLRDGLVRSQANQSELTPPQTEA
jgi:DNA-binding MarR family transcriptional regulator